MVCNSIAGITDTIIRRVTFHLHTLARKSAAEESKISELYCNDLALIFNDTVFLLDEAINGDLLIFPQTLTNPNPIFSLPIPFTVLLQEMFSTKKDIFYWDHMIHESNYWVSICS
jgi:hypothetical protein